MSFGTANFFVLILAFFFLIIACLAEASSLPKYNNVLEVMQDDLDESYKKIKTFMASGGHGGCKAGQKADINNDVNEEVAIEISPARSKSFPSEIIVGFAIMALFFLGFKFMDVVFPVILCFAAIILFRLY